MSKEIKYKLDLQERRVEKIEEIIIKLKEDSYRKKGSDELITRGQRTATLIILLLTCVVSVFQIIKMTG